MVGTIGKFRRVGLVIFCGLWASTVSFMNVQAETPGVEIETPAGEAVNRTAIRINGKNISYREVEGRFHEFLELKLQSAGFDEPSTEALQAFKNKAWDDAVHDLISNELLDQTALSEREEMMARIVKQAYGPMSQRRIKAYFQRAVEASLRKMKAREISAAGGEKELGNALRRRGITRAQWEENLKKELFRQHVLNKYLGYMYVGPKEAGEFYETHKEKFRKPTLWKLRRIIVKKSAYGSTKDARQAARIVYKSVVEDKKDFAKLAKRVSDDPLFKKTGGLMGDEAKGGWHLDGSFKPEEMAATKLQDGEVTRPIEISDSIFLIKREGYKSGGLPTLKKIYNQVEAMAYQEKIRQRKNAFHKKMRDEALVKILIKAPPKN